jgi:hypothetical protein
MLILSTPSRQIVPSHPLPNARRWTARPRPGCSLPLHQAHHEQETASSRSGAAPAIDVATCSLTGINQALREAWATLWVVKTPSTYSSR